MEAARRVAGFAAKLFQVPELIGEGRVLLKEKEVAHAYSSACH
jgi:hypothetical protein